MISRVLGALFLYAWMHQRGRNVILSQVVTAQQAEIDRLKLEYSRWGLGMLEEFLIALDKPEQEDELRRKLSDAVIDMQDEVARIEEHATT